MGARSSSPITNQNLTMVAYEKLKQAIVRNQLRTGNCISGNKIAKKLNMSRTPVREAIQLLEKEGLVEIQNGVGFFVRQLTIKEMQEITEVRKLLECAALRASVEYFTQNSIQHLIDLWVSAKKNLSTRDQAQLETIRQLDSQTHNFLTHHCNNSYLIEILTSIDVRSTRIQYLSVDSHNVDGAVDQHVEILEALLQHDIARAVDLLEKHIYFAVTYLQSHPYLLDYGSGFYISDTDLDNIF